MKRFAVPLVIAGSLTILVALLWLLRSITSTAPAAPVATVPPRTAEPAPSTPPPSMPAPGTAPSVPHTAPASTGERMPTLPAGGESPPSTAGGSSDDAPPGTKLNTKNLHLGMPALREKIAANTSQVAACLVGKRSTGEVSLTFIAGKKANQIEVEQTDVDGEKTTIDDQGVLDCIMAATRSIRLDGLPRDAPAIMVYRSISLQDGKITDDKPTKFSYIR